MTRWDPIERPNRFPWPPVLLVAMIAVGFGLQAVLALQVERSPALQGAGALLIAGALALDVWASLTFRTARTTILPHRASDNLATGGPFAFSRNPIYLGNLAILAGVGLLAGSLWHVVLVPVLALCVQHLAIKREEAHLAARFPEAWQAYARTVRRWL